MACNFHPRHQFMLGLLLFLASNLTSCLVTSFKVGSEAEVSGKSAASYNILMMCPYSSASHMNTFMPFIEALLDRGHKVTMLHNNYKFDHTPHENLTMLHHKLQVLLMEKINIFTISSNVFQLVKFFPNMMWVMTRDFYKDPTVSRLYQQKDDFDVVVLDGYFNDFALPFSYKKPFITLLGAINDPIKSAQFGNLVNPVIIGNSYHHYPVDAGLLTRAANLALSIVVPLGLLVAYIPIQYQLSQQFPDLPSIWSMNNNQSLMLTMSHFSVDDHVPQVPGQVDITGIHCREGRPLPQDLEQFLSSEVPVVLVSFGTTASYNIPLAHKKMFIETFSGLPYKFIVQFGDDNKGFPSNVISRRWLPQQDLLAHPNIKLFITHGGTLGGVESICHATPTLSLQVNWDHVRVSERLHNLGVGISLPWKELNRKIIEDSVREIITNPSYQEEVSSRSGQLRDQLTTPQQRAVYWTEYVIRHQGAQHLIPQERNMSWITLLHIDVFILFIIIALLVYWVASILIAILKYVYLICKERWAGKKRVNLVHTSTKKSKNN